MHVLVISVPFITRMPEVLTDLGSCGGFCDVQIRASRLAILPWGNLLEDGSRHFSSERRPNHILQGEGMYWYEFYYDYFDFFFFGFRYYVVH